MDDQLAIPEDYGFPASPNVYEVKRWMLQEKFLAAFAETGAINLSAATAECSVEAYYHWLSADSYMFQKRFERAKAQVLESMVIEIDRRAFKGYDHPVIHQGKITGTYKVYDSNLAMFRVKKLDPSYRDSADIAADTSAIRSTLEELRKMGTARLTAPAVVDGESRPVPEDEPSQTLPEEEEPPQTGSGEAK